MKKLIIILILLSLASCSGLKNIKDKTTNTKQTEYVEKVKDSVSNTETNQEIKDRIVINVPKTDNKELTEMFNSMMRQLNTSKTSGSNSYKSRYDEDLKQWVVDFMVGQTQNLNTAINESEKSEKSFEENISEYWKKVVIPWWIYLVAAFVFMPQIKMVLGFISPLLKFFTKA